MPPIVVKLEKKINFPIAQKLLLCKNISIRILSSESLRIEAKQQTFLFLLQEEKGKKSMHKILERRQYSENVFYLRVEAPFIAKSRKAGQFVIVQLDEDLGERIPLTIADANDKEGWIALVVQIVGATTLRMSRMKVGEAIPVLLGPLGLPSHIKQISHVVCVCGGIGVAPMYPIAQEFKRIGARLTVIIGARNKSLIVFEEEMKEIADELIITTDDGSYGRKALVTEPLKELCESDVPPDEVFAIGPPIMMKFCAETTRPFGVSTVVSLNTLMVDGTGMCGCCRITVGGDVKFVCVDGPDFDAHKVDFDNMMSRMRSFKENEAQAYHKCKSGFFG